MRSFGQIKGGPSVGGASGEPASSPVGGAAAPAECKAYRPAAPDVLACACQEPPPLAHNENGRLSDWDKTAKPKLAPGAGAFRISLKAALLTGRRQKL